MSTYRTAAAVSALPIGILITVPVNGTRIPKIEYPMTWAMGPMAASGAMYPA